MLSASAQQFSARSIHLRQAKQRFKPRVKSQVQLPPCPPPPEELKILPQLKAVPPCQAQD